MAIRIDDLPRILVERIEASFPAPAIFDADETSTWPDGTLQKLLESGVLGESQRAETVICDGCAEQCVKSVVVRTAPKAESVTAIVACDEEPRFGIIKISPARLRRYTATLTMLVVFLVREFRITACLNSQREARIRLGKATGRYGSRDVYVMLDNGLLTLAAGHQKEQLITALRWINGSLHADRGVLQRLLNRKQKRVSDRYQPDRTEQKKKRRRTTSEDHAVLKEALRRKAETGATWTLIAKQIEGMQFLKQRRGRSGALSAARIRKIICELRKR